MSVNWRARRERAQRNKPPRVVVRPGIPTGNDCTRCGHDQSSHIRHTIAVGQPCKVRIYPDGAAVTGASWEECSCTDFVTPESPCTCGHAFKVHDIIEASDCSSSWCHCDRFVKAHLSFTSKSP